MNKSNKTWNIYKKVYFIKSAAAYNIKLNICGIKISRFTDYDLLAHFNIGVLDISYYISGEQRNIDEPMAPCTAAMDTFR